jgi:tRNA pseudouridine55 synthase
MDGILVLDKPSGMTSHQAVAKVRRILGEKRAGHTGTLDPDVSGVLPICIGKATRLAEYMTELPKTYQGTICFGFSTDTQDASGKPLDFGDAAGLTMTRIREAAGGLTGEVEQTPPAFSAVKVQGRRAYDLARQGISASLPRRRVMVYSFDVEDLKQAGSCVFCHFTVRCSKGTYVRTLCHDLGLAVGVPAHMAELRRTEAGGFSEEEAVSLETLEADALRGEVARWILPVEAAVRHLPGIVVDHAAARRIRSGQTIVFRGTVREPENRIGTSREEVKVLSMENRLIALGRRETASDRTWRIRPVKVFAGEGEKLCR